MTGRWRQLAAAAVVVLAAGACADPEAGAPDTTEAAQDPITAETPDPTRDALVAEVGALTGVLAGARGHLEEAAGSDGVASARAAGEAATELLAGDPTGETALFPLETSERGVDGERADQLSATLSIAREAGGDGRAVSAVLRDLVAGDLGAWQRDAEGMIARVEDAARPAGSLEATERAVFELPGEGTRALAWAMLTRDATDRERAVAYAERGAAHLEVALAALEDLDLDPEDEGEDDS